MKKLILAITLFLLISIVSFAQIREVKEIKIISAIGWTDEEHHSELLIKYEKGGYFLDGNKIEKKLINELLKAINEPLTNEPQLKNLGITRKWLNENVEREEINNYVGVFKSSLEGQKQLYRRSFTNPEIIKKTFYYIFPGATSDYYPQISIEITKKDGKKIKVFSKSQTILSLPWEITEQGKTAKTYNANISRAISNLMPDKTANKRRLNGEDIARELASRVKDEIKYEWDFLEVESKAGETLNALTKNYKIKSVEINHYHSLEFGEKWGKGKVSPSYLHAILEEDGFPEGFSINLTLPFTDEKVENFQLFQEKISKYQTLVFSVDWLKDYVKTKANIQIRFVKDKSLSNKAMKIFADDMKKIGKDDLVTEVEKERDNIALVLIGAEYQDSYWLILPNKKMILWRYGYDALIKWKKENFEAKECSDYVSSRDGCVGAVISPTGNIISK